jgi:uncharacterized protein (DUF952 family)
LIAAARSDQLAHHVGRSAHSVGGMTELLHITERSTWDAAVARGEYRMSTRGTTLEQQGFVHCSLPHQLRGVAESFYGDLDDLVVLVVDSDRLSAVVKHEPAAPGGEEFPHIYGPIAIDAVVDVIPVTRDEGGRMILPD